jgi:hypothetical protein
MVRSPVAVTVTSFPSSGTPPRSIGSVSSKVAVGNWSTSMIRPSNWPSRCDRPLSKVVMSTSKVAAVTVVPSMVASPVTPSLRPTASESWPKSTSLMR